ncbi:hypothetical protein ANCCEY_03481 [Ancylostoma ceylanicum]|uniref:Uncharacterized protein n=1 Tax=Ancylostoma ceylanicum TaxID=53326 RepID=A0A0D6M1R2_9BILA|nr:hypothetical protein ANCCEY_03481 [Ancylostoma ceylanicum]
MEAVKPRKPKHKQRSPVRQPPPLPARPAVVQGMRLPDVPQHEPCRASTPEPEEIEITDDELPTMSTVPEDTPIATPNEAEQKQNGIAEEGEKSAAIVEASSLPAQVAVFEPVNYPAIPQLSESAMNSTYTTSIAPPLYEVTSKGYKEKEKLMVAEPQVADAPPLYPSLSKLHYEKDKHGLLTEQNLLAFYHNPMYMMSDEFVDKFVQNNLISSGPLFPLLKRLKRLCEQMAISEVSEKENTENLSKCLRDCWVMQQQTFETKILDTGLSTYCSPTYKQFCKQIGNSLRFGLWQFLVDLPYDCVSEDCRSRCEYFLRSSEKITVSEVYDIPISEIVARNRVELYLVLGGLKERAEAIGPLDSVFLINTLASILSYSHNDAAVFIKEIIEPPDDVANRVARRVLSSLHWGPNETGDALWLDPAVHEITADTVMKAHSTHCGHSNGMISKSIRQISKLASRMADHEQLFNQFCWDILIKMKLSPKATLQVFGSIAHLAFLNDAKNLLGIPEIIYNTYQQMLVTWREGSKGLFSMFTAEQAPPPLIASTMFEVAPWATYLLLLVESKSYSTFYQFLHEAFVKKDKTTVEQAVKKASSKSSLALPLARLAVYRWAEFVALCSKSTVFPLAVQRLATEAYRLKSVNGRKYCFARRLLDAPQADSILSPCRKVLNEVDDPKGLAKAVSGWLFCSHEVTRMGFNFSVFDLDYLLQLILADDMNIWVDFIDNNKLVQEELQEEKLYSLTCHLGRREPVHQVSEQFLSKPSASRAVGFPTLPAHPCLPSAPVIDMSALFQLNTVMEMVKPLIKHIHTLSEDYVIGGDNMASEDSKYAELLTKLHTPVSQQIPVQLRCGIRCTAPHNTAVQVTGTKFNETVDAEMAQSREKRNTLLGELHTGVLDRTAVASATMEHIARQVARLSVLCSSSNRTGAQMTGRALFKTVTSSLSGSEMLFPAASAAYENTLRLLAEEFVRMQPPEQIPVMVLVLEGFALSDPLIENLPSLLWQFYCEKLSILSHGSTHYFAVLERHFVRIPWPSFYPSERGLTAMDECLATKSPCCAPFIAQIVVRIMWKDVLTSHVSRGVEPQPLSAPLLKQTAWIRTECALVLRGGATAAPPAYNSLIADVDAVAQQHENLRAFSIAARELTALWCRISDAKFGEALVTTWNAYIDANHESPLVLTSLNTLIGSLNVDQLTTALKCMEKTIRAYFKRNTFSWSELMQWAQCPNNLTVNVRDYLLSVSSSNKAYPLMLTTSWFLKFVPPSDAVFSGLHAFVTSIKPK